jgi:hypothetical protein
MSIEWHLWPKHSEVVAMCVVAQPVDCLTTDWTTGVRSPAEAKGFSFGLCVQTGSEAHPASYPMGTEGPFLGTMHGWDLLLTTHPHLMPKSRMSSSYISSPNWRLHAITGKLYFTFQWSEEDRLLSHRGILSCVSTWISYRIIGNN